MKLWVISQTANDGYDTYDSAVVAAETEDEAKLIHPNGELGLVWGSHTDYAGENFTGWGRSGDYSWRSSEWTYPKNVSAVYIGEAAPGKRGVILGSFNAG